MEPSSAKNNRRPQVEVGYCFWAAGRALCCKSSPGKHRGLSRTGSPTHRGLRRPSPRASRAPGFPRRSLPRVLPCSKVLLRKCTPGKCVFKNRRRHKVLCFYRQNSRTKKRYQEEKQGFGSLSACKIHQQKTQLGRDARFCVSIYGQNTLPKTLLGAPGRGLAETAGKAPQKNLIKDRCG